MGKLSNHFRFADAGLICCLIDYFERISKTLVYLYISLIFCLPVFSANSQDKMSTAPPSRKEALTSFIQQIHGRPVVVKLNSGVDYRGVLACLDGYMNIALEQTEEYVNGQLKNKYGDAFIRGNNVLYISTQKRKL